MSNGFDAEGFCKALEQDGIFISVRKFATNAAEYFTKFKETTGEDFDQEGLSGRQERRMEAVKYGKGRLKKCLATVEDDKKKKVPPMCHLEFAIAIEAHLPARKNALTKKNEHYIEEHGIWVEDGGDIKGGRSRGLAEGIRPTIVEVCGM